MSFKYLRKGNNLLLTQNFPGPKIFQDQKFSLIQNFLGPNFFQIHNFDLNIFGLKISCDHRIFISKFVWYPQFVWPQIFFGHKLILYVFTYYMKDLCLMKLFNLSFQVFIVLYHLSMFQPCKPVNRHKSKNK